MMVSDDKFPVADLPSVFAFCNLYTLEGIPCIPSISAKFVLVFPDHASLGFGDNDSEDTSVQSGAPHMTSKPCSPNTQIT